MMSDLDKKRDEMAENYASQLVPFAHDMWRAYYLAHKAGFGAALEALREAPVEFDERAGMQAANDTYPGANNDQYRFAFRDGARWQFERDRERIASSELQYKAALDMIDDLGKASAKQQARIAELEFENVELKREIGYLNAQPRPKIMRERNEGLKARIDELEECLVKVSRVLEGISVREKTNIEEYIREVCTEALGRKAGE